jgi:hypothetical protein
MGGTRTSSLYLKNVSGSEGLDELLRMREPAVFEVPAEGRKKDEKRGTKSGDEKRDGVW